MEFGVRLPQNGPFATIRNLTDAAQRLENAGFDSAWVHDGSMVPFPEDRYDGTLSTGSVEGVDADGGIPKQYEAMTVIANLGAKTEKIKFGTAATVLPFWNPIILARVAATVQEMTDGRLILGAAIGGSRRSFENLDIPYGTRGKMTDEYLRMLKGVLTPNPITSFSGSYVKFQNLCFYPAPRRVPIWSCGRSLQAIERAVEFCDGWMPGRGYSPKKFEEDLPKLQELASAHRRNLSRSFAVGLESLLCMADTTEKAMQISTATLKAKRIEPSSTWTFIGSARDITKRLEEYVRAGTNFVQFKIIAHDYDQYIKMAEEFSRTALPSFK